jgi:hypothetical protein
MAGLVIPDSYTQIGFRVVVGRSFRNANQVTVLGRPISIVVIAER